MSTRNVLVVEDDDDSRQALCSMLEVLKLNPIPFALAKDALQALDKHKFAVALLDVMMPEMNGYELLAELRKIPALASLPVIMITAKDESEEILQGYKHGADYYIPKPYNLKQLEFGIKLFIKID